MINHTQTIHRQKPTNCLSMFDHFARLALKVLKQDHWLKSRSNVKVHIKKGLFFVSTSGVCPKLMTLEQIAKLKRTWNLAPVFQIVQKITENYCSCLYLSTSQVWWLHDLWFRRYIQKCTLSHVLILILTSLIWQIMGWLKIQKFQYLENRI